MTITFAKLRDDSWGCRLTKEKGVPGQTVTIVRKDGVIKPATLDRCVWAADDGLTSLWTLVPAAGKRRGCRCSEGSDCCGEHGARCRCGPQCVCRGGNVFDCG